MPKRTKKELLSGFCKCANCRYDREKDKTKFVCVDCQKEKNGEIHWEGYKGKHGPICNDCEVGYQSDT